LCTKKWFQAFNVQKAKTKNGFSVWVRALQSIVQHECSESHIETSLKFKLYPNFFAHNSTGSGKTTARESNEPKSGKKFNRHNFFLAKNCIAFRGYRENLFYIGNRGNFMNLTKMIAKYFPPLATYTAKLEL